jgi:glycosyltransferase involved in cell wall biosynthesis
LIKKTMTEASPAAPQRVLYHHRTQGKAVEGVHIRGVVDALRARGTQVDMVCLPGADPYVTPKAMSPTQQARKWMKIVSWMPEPLFELAEIAYNFIALFKLLAQLRRAPDTAFIYERYALFTFAGVLAGRLKNIPVILEVNDSAIVERVRPLFFQWIATHIERWCMRKTSGLIFVSKVFLQRVSQAHGGVLAPAIVSPNAANLAQFSVDEVKRQQVRQQYGFEECTVCGYLGAFVPWHKIDAFVYAIAPRLREAPHLRLLLVGDGAVFPELQRFVAEQQLSKQVILTGRVAHQEVPGLLAAMDMAILPSAGSYTSPVKLFEFMACGIAPVAPDLEPVQEIVQEGQTGWFFPHGQLPRAVDAVLERSRDMALLKQVGASARRYIGQHHEWRHNVDDLLDLVQRVS